MVTGSKTFLDMEQNGLRHLTDKECFGTRRRPNKGSQSGTEGYSVWVWVCVRVCVCGEG